MGRVSPDQHPRSNIRPHRLFAIVFGLLLLVTVTGLPLWLVSAFITFTYVLVVPGSSVAMAMLHGDSVAEKEGAEKAEPVEV